MLNSNLRTTCSYVCYFNTRHTRTISFIYTAAARHHITHYPTTTVLGQSLPPHVARSGAHATVCQHHCVFTVKRDSVLSTCTTQWREPLWHLYCVNCTHCESVGLRGNTKTRVSFPDHLFHSQTTGLIPKPLAPLLNLKNGVTTLGCTYCTTV